MIKLVMLCHLTKHIHKIVSDSESVRGILYMYDRALENSFSYAISVDFNLGGDTWASPHV